MHILGHRPYEGITLMAPTIYGLFKKNYSEVGLRGFDDIRAEMEDSLDPFTTGKLEGGVLVWLGLGLRVCQQNPPKY